MLSNDIVDICRVLHTFLYDTPYIPMSILTVLYDTKTYPGRKEPQSNSNCFVPTMDGNAVLKALPVCLIFGKPWESE